ncbi:MAG TPA: creatininase family protein [Ramlibacter sp.]|uniref:creatininase family protein n=1 Tax=Ramlibacter sp. TaxID=1917967 RepID=UPI002BFEB4EE|nr:creatininase family protein [Ramlibacter sp.]HVZ44131.1 creatininase family protein [Ramlibacter sp.]
MPTPSRFWADLTTGDFARLEPVRTVAVLPLGATEQHGPHLPLSVDRSLVDGIVSAALPHLAAELPALFLPTQAVGYSPEHSAFDGTLTLSWQTVLSTWIDIGGCVAAAGLKKILLFNAHGGQVSLMDIAARELRKQHGLIAYSCSWWNLPLGEAAAQFSAEEHRFGVHAGEIETSLMLALAPERVDMARARRFASASQQRARTSPILGNGVSAKLGWQIQDYNAEGAAGNAAAATPEKGRRLLDAAGQQLALLVAEISGLPLSTLADPPGAPSRE